MRRIWLLVRQPTPDLRADIEECLRVMHAGKGSTPYFEKAGPLRNAVWRKAAERDSPDGQWLLSRCMQLGIANNEAKAIDWCRKAAEQNHAPAQNNLGWLYEHGRGVPRDMDRAIEWYRKAADLRFAVAQFNLGLLYQEGRGVAKNENAARVLFRQAADQDYVPAKNKLIEKNTQFKIKGHTRQVSSVSYSPDGKRIVSGSWDWTLKVWDLETGQEIRSLNGHRRTGIVTSVSYSPDGKRIVSASADRTLKVWNADNGSLIGTLRGHTGEVCNVAISPDGNRIVSGSVDRSLKVWDADMGKSSLFIPAADPTSAPFDFDTSVAFSPDGLRIVSGSRDKTLKAWTLKVWDVLTGQQYSPSRDTRPT